MDWYTTYSIVYWNKLDVYLAFVYLSESVIPCIKNMARSP